MTISNFPIEIFGKSEKISDTLTKRRARIFYLGANRNGGYITENFAETLIGTLPYTPIKGIYDEEDKEDFTDHGRKRSDGKIYGITPESHNFAWEDHEDKDGVTRKYATCDVYLFTALYPEAEEIMDKPLSMELYEPTLTGEWLLIDGASLYKYKSGSFLGLQVLGEDVEPCFEGAAFFSLETLQSQKMLVSLMSLFEKLEQLIGRNMSMNKDYNPNFALSDRQKRDKIFQALNPETIRYWPLDVYDSYVVIVDLETEDLYRVNYVKDDKKETVTLEEEKTIVFADYVTEEEKEALNELRGKTEEGTFTSLNTAFALYVKNIEDMKVELNDKDEKISTLEIDGENFTKEIGTLKTQLKEFSDYKEEVEKAEKEAVLTKYSTKLQKEVIEKYTEKMVDYSSETLEKELAYELVKSDESIFTLDSKGGYVPKPDDGGNSLEALLNKYKK